MTAKSGAAGAHVCSVRATTWCVVLAAGAAGHAIGVQPEVPGPAIVNAPAMVQLSGSIDLARLLDLCSSRLKVVIEYDPAQLKAQQVTWRSPLGMTDAQLWAAANRLLGQRGFTTVRIAGTDGFSVVKLDDAGKAASAEPAFTATAAAAKLAENPGVVRPGFRNAAIRLEHVSTRDAIEAVKPALRPGVQNVPAGQAVQIASGVVSVADLTPRVDEAVEILARFDRPENATVVEELMLKHVTAAQAVTLATQLASKREAVAGDKLVGEVVAGASGGTLLVIAPKRLQSQWESLISRVDRREPVETVTYSPRLFSVREVAPLVQQIAGATGGGGGGAGGAGANADDRLKVLIEEPTGSLLVTATPTQHAKIAELIARLDSVTGESRRPLRTFVVRNRSVLELIGVLDRLISAGVLEATADDAARHGGSSLVGTASNGITPAMLPPGANPMSTLSTVPGGASGATGSGPLLGSGTPVQPNASRPRGTLPITLTYDEATSTIIAIGESRLIEQVGQLIKSLDVRQPQVMLEVMLVTLSDSDTIDFGIELERFRVDGKILTRLSSLFGISSTATVGGAAARTTGEAAGFSGVVLDPGEFAVVVRALQNVNSGKTVSLPRVLVANNQQATFNGVVQQPYASSFTAGNSSTPTTTFGGTQDAGTQISVKPQITDGEALLLQYNLSFSAFTGKASATLPPPRQVNSVTSQASIPDGYTVVVGGLEVTSEGDTAAQIPIVGSIPILGELFKNQTKAQSRSRFFVFIHAGVMRGSSLEELRNVSDQQLRQAQIPSGWPENEPQVIR